MHMSTSQTTFPLCLVNYVALNMGNKKIIIVGAGASGLAAASRLVKLGIDCDDITILEAQSRIGGRIHTIIEGSPQPLSMQT